MFSLFRKRIEMKSITAVIDSENAVIEDRDAVINEKIAVIREAAKKKLITGSKAEELIKIVTELEIEKIIEREDIEKILKCKRTKAIGILNILEQLGIIITISGQGKGKYTVYVEK